MAHKLPALAEILDTQINRESQRCSARSRSAVAGTSHDLYEQFIGDCQYLAFLTNGQACLHDH